MRALIERGRALGNARAARVRTELVASVEAGVTDVAASIEDEAVVVAGPGLRWRSLREPALRWIGRMR